MRAFGPNEMLFILYALRWTLTLTLIAFVGGGIVGIVLALFGIARSRILRAVTTLYIQVIQGIPLLVLIFICYYMPALFGMDLGAIWAAAIALTIHASAFLGAIWESALRAIPKPQWESAESLALSRFEAMRHVIAPQAIRLALPSTVGFLVQVIKQTSLASIIGFVEITRAGQLVSNATFDPLKAFLTVAVLYFIVCFPITQLSLWMERRTARGQASM